MAFQVVLGEVSGPFATSPLVARLSPGAMAALDLGVYSPFEIRSPATGRAVLCVAEPTQLDDGQIEVHGWAARYLGGDMVQLSKPAEPASTSRCHLRLAAVDGDDAVEELIAKTLADYRLRPRIGCAFGVQSLSRVAAYVVLSEHEVEEVVEADEAPIELLWGEEEKEPPEKLSVSVSVSVDVPVHIAPKRHLEGVVSELHDLLCSFWELAESKYGRRVAGASAVYDRPLALLLKGVEGVGKTQAAAEACAAMADEGVPSYFVDARRCILEAAEFKDDHLRIIEDDLGRYCPTMLPASPTLERAVERATETRGIVVLDNFDEVLNGARAALDSSFAAEHRRQLVELGACLRLARQLDDIKEPPCLFVITRDVMHPGFEKGQFGNIECCLNPKRYDRTVTIDLPTVEDRRSMYETRAFSKECPVGWAAAFATMTAGLSRSQLARSLDLAQIDAHSRGQVVSWSEVASGVAAQAGKNEQERVLPPLEKSEAWNGVGGLRVAKAEITKALIWPRTKAAEFKRFNLTPPRGVVLHGPPGCGKTILARAAAEKIEAAFISVRSSELQKEYLGESEATVRALFAQARSSKPCVLFLDEIDAVGFSRDNVDTANGSTVHLRLVATLLTEIDGVKQNNEGLTVLAATNRLETLDSALVRPGRLEVKVYVGPPDVEDRRDILAMKAPCVAEDVDLEAIAVATEGCTSAQLTSLCRDAAFAALDESHESTAISLRHFREAANTLRARHSLSSSLIQI